MYINYRVNIHIKQHSKVTYVECIDEDFSAQSMATKVTDKINYGTKFLYNFLTSTLRHLLCNVLMHH